MNKVQEGDTAEHTFYVITNAFVVVLKTGIKILVIFGVDNFLHPLIAFFAIGFSCDITDEILVVVFIFFEEFIRQSLYSNYSVF